MTLALYQIDGTFETTRSTLSEGLRPGLFDTLHIVVYRAVREDRFSPAAAAREFAAYLDLDPRDIDPFFTRPSRAEAETICTNVAGYFFNGLTSIRLMPQTQATALAAAWMAQFDESTAFFSNTTATASAIRLGGGHGLLFHLDHEAGVLAVSPTKAGLFWSAEDG